jgi:microcystin-dependent protein
MRINPFGNVGIGISTPQSKLDVNGGINVSGYSVFNSTLCASTLCTSTLSMANGQVSGVSSINSFTGSVNITATNTSTIGNLNVSGNLNVAGDFLHPDVPPVGAINMYGGSSDPPGWLICDGRNFSVLTYPTLYSIIQNSFGGVPLSNFNIPDMQARFPVGVGAGYAMGQTGGFVSTTLTTNELPSHAHSITDPGHTHTATHNLQVNNTNSGGNNLTYENDTSGGPSPMVITIAANFTGITGTNLTGGGQAFDNRPPYIGINYIIKY